MPASLIHTTPDGTRDVALDANTRIYFLTGGQHGAGSIPPVRGQTQNLTNPLDMRWAMRALLVDFHEWLKDGLEPPASLYPRIAAGELVRPSEVQYPAGVRAPRFLRVPRVLDFGPEFLSKGIITIEPPREGDAYSVLVPQMDKDGNERAGVHLPELQAPLGVYTGWNLRTESIGAPDRMIAFIGSFFPFAPGQVKQRYGTKAAYIERIRQAADQLADRRLVLKSDVPSIGDRAAQLWDALKLPE
jgi:hypothetical protein